MRYWIYWNELIQGPFELEELVSLHAFSESLLVCMEDRQDWLPAGRVADLAPELDILRARRTAPPPSPPPPSGPPSKTPLQGEFFGESPGQQHLFESGDEKKGPYAYRPALDDSPESEHPGTLTVTMPIRFGIHLPTVPKRSVEIPATPREPIPFPKERTMNFVPPPVITESPAPLEIPQAEPPMEPPPVTSFRPIKPVVLGELTEPNADILQTESSSGWLRENRFGLLPWLLAALLGLGILGSGGYWMMDHYTSKSAIAEVNQHTEMTRATSKFLKSGRAQEKIQATGPSPALSAVANAPTSEPGAKTPKAANGFWHKLMFGFRTSSAAPAVTLTKNPESLVDTDQASGALADKAELQNNRRTGQASAPSDTRGAAGNVSAAARPMSTIGTLAARPDAMGKLAGIFMRLFGMANPIQTDTVSSSGQSAATPGVASLEHAGAIVNRGQAASAARPGDISLPRAETSKSFTDTERGQRTAENSTGEGRQGRQGSEPYKTNGIAGNVSSTAWPASTIRALAARPDAMGKLAGILMRLFGMTNPVQTEAASSSGQPPAAPDVTFFERSGGIVNRGQTASAAKPGEIGLPQAETNKSFTDTERGQGTAENSIRGSRRPQQDSTPSDTSGAVGNASSVGRPVSTIRTLAARPDAIGKLAGILVRLFGMATPLHTDTVSSNGLPPAASDLSPMSGKSGHASPHLNRVNRGRHPGRNKSPSSTPSKAASSGYSSPAAPFARPMKTQTIAVRNPTVPGLSSSAATLTPMGVKPDPWARRYDEAMHLVQGRTIFSGKRTVGNHAKQMLSEMHEKELLHAADTGERLYLPDKMSWSALHEEGPRYRVYLNFSALQANGERVQARSYQFVANLENHDVSSDDTATLQDFLENGVFTVHPHNPMADDIESALSAVDLLNKQKMRAMIVEKGHRGKKEEKIIHQATVNAQAKLQREIVYFRSRYTEKILRNIAKAYVFSDLLKTNG